MGREGQGKEITCSEEFTLFKEMSSFVLAPRRQPLSPGHFPSERNVVVIFGEPLGPHVILYVETGHTRKTNRVWLES